MEVKRVKTDSGYIKYVVNDCNHVCNHVRIESPYSYMHSSGSWAISIPNLSSPTNYGGYSTVAIYYSRTLNEIKEVLSRFSTEEELFGAYYKGRLEGKYHLY